MQPIASLAGIAENVSAVCRSQPVTVAYLFGSHARGTADAQSDIDIALLLDPASKEDRFEMRLRLQRTLADALGCDPERIDLVILQDVPPLLQFNVIRTGQLLFMKDDVAKRDFELAVERAYEDESPYLDREAETTLHRILSHAR